MSAMEQAQAKFDTLKKECNLSLEDKYVITRRRESQVTTVAIAAVAAVVVISTGVAIYKAIRS